MTYGSGYGYRRRETASGAKARTRPECVDRTIPYRDWHRLQGRDLFVVDVDQVEVRIEGGKVVPVAVVELTFCPTGLAGYAADRVPVLEAVWARLDPERAGNLQGYVIRGVGRRLGVPSYVVAFEVDDDGRLARLAVRPLDKPGEWRMMLPHEYADFLGEL